MKKVRVLLVWSGGVNPAYRPFFEALGNIVDLEVLSPPAWRHGSIDFLSPGIGGKNSAYAFTTSRFVFLGGGLYLLPWFFLRLLRRKPQVLYWMDEPDRITVALHALGARLLLPRLKVCAYALQNIPKPAYAHWPHRLAWLSNKALLQGLIAATRQAAGVAIGHGFTKPMVEIPLFASKDFFYPPNGKQREMARTRLGIHPETYVLAYAGSLHPAKGILRLARVMKRFPNLALIVASGEAWPDEEKAAHPEKHLGQLLGHDLLKLYHAADAVILPSEAQPHWQEQVGRILIEGGLCGCLALGSDSGSLPEVIGDGDCLFKSGDDDDMIRFLGGLPFATGKRKAAEQRLRFMSRYEALPVAEKTACFLTGLVYPTNSGDNSETLARTGSKFQPQGQP